MVTVSVLVFSLLVVLASVGACATLLMLLSAYACWSETREWRGINHG